MDKLKQKYLQSVKDALDEYFEHKSTYQQNEGNMGNNRNYDNNDNNNIREVHHYHHNRYPILDHSVSPPFMQPPVIINNNPPSYSNRRTSSSSKDEDEKESDNSTVKVVSVLAGAATAAIGTYVIAKDEYVNFCLSNLDERMDRLRQLKDPEFFELIAAYDEWKTLFEKRTKPQTYAKATTIGSILGGLGGAYVASSVCILTGAAGATVGGCYLLWKYLTTKKRSEDQAFADFKSKLAASLTRVPSSNSAFNSQRAFRLGDHIPQEGVPRRHEGAPGGHEIPTEVSDEGQSGHTSPSAPPA